MGNEHNQYWSQYGLLTNTIGSHSVFLKNWVYLPTQNVTKIKTAFLSTFGGESTIYSNLTISSVYKADQILHSYVVNSHEAVSRLHCNIFYQPRIDLVNNAGIAPRLESITPQKIVTYTDVAFTFGHGESKGAWNFHAPLIRDYSRSWSSPTPDPDIVKERWQNCLEQITRIRRDMVNIVSRGDS